MEQTLPPHQLEEARPFLRVTLTRGANGNVSISSVSAVELSEVPLPAAYGDHLLVAQSGGTPRSARLVAFDSQLRISTVDADGRHTHATRELDTASATVFIEGGDDLDALDLLGPDGERVASADPRAAVRSESQSTPRLSSPRAIAREQLAELYPAIQFVGPGDEASLDPALLEGATLLEPEGASADAIASALSAMAVGLRGAVTTIGVVDWPTSDAGSTRFGAARGSQFLLNGNLRNADDRRDTVVHEVTHNFVNLSRPRDGASSAFANWPASARASVTAALQRYGVARDLVSVWTAMQRSGVAGEYTFPYAGDDYPRLSASQAARGGFATPYGASNADEDIAEYAMAITTRHITDICARFAGGPRLSPRIAIPYAKMLLLRGVGIIDDEHFDACVQGARIESAPGIHFEDGPSFTSDVRAGFATSGPRAFRVLGKGANTYHFMIELILRGGDAPALGLHRLDDIWFLNVGASDLSGAYLANDDPFRARAGEQGLVLIAEANADRVLGAVFGLALQNAIGLNTDNLPYGTFLVEP